MNKHYKANTFFTRICNVKYNLTNQRLFMMVLYAAILFVAFVILLQTLVDRVDIFYQNAHNTYNSSYPLSSPLVEDGGITYKIMAIADLDTKSKLNENQHKFSSFLLKGTIKLSNDLKTASINFDNEPIEISSQYSYGNRGMELSELVVFNGHLYSCDDRTGIIYEIFIEKKLAIPWVILPDGNGEYSGKGFKCEWMTVKDKKLYVGGLGKEWTTPQGVLVNHNPQWIKIIGHKGDVVHLDWTENYNKIRSSLGFSYPGYMIFESCVWSSQAGRFFFLPRRASSEAYDEVLDEKRATNLLINTDSEFKAVDYETVGRVIPTRGYSSFKFVPNTNEQLIIALKTEEDSGETRSFVCLLDAKGNILVKDIRISNDLKYEGVEFV